MVKSLKLLAVVVTLVAALGMSSASALAAGSNPARRIAAVNTLERQVLTEINVVRARRGLAALRMSRPLSAAADLHSRKMAQLGFFSHNSADGTSFWKRVQRFYGWNGFRTWSVGENLLWSSPEIDAGGAVQMWMDSPGHRANLLSTQWREIGLSAVFVPAAPGIFGGRDVTIVTADFGIRR